MYLFVLCIRQSSKITDKIVLTFCLVIGIGFLLQGTKNAMKLQEMKENYIKTEGQYIGKEIYREGVRGKGSEK